MKPPLAFRGGGDFNATPLPLELVLAYEDGPTAQRAKRAVEAVLTKPEVNVRPQLHLWRLDLLSDPEVSKRAAQEASAADILVVAMHGRNRLASQTEAHLKQWVGLKSAKPRALVLSLDADTKPQAAEHSTLVELRSAAVRNGVAVMLHYGEPLRPMPGTDKADAPNRAPFIARYDDFHQPPNPHPHWGIND